jgi:dTDP-4-dehydrorhamnose reductase
MILVTGASGILGSSLLGVASQRELRVRAVVNTQAAPFGWPTAVKLDLTDFARVGAVVADSRPTVVIHAAANTDVDWCEANPSLARAIHVDATHHLARAAAACSAAFVYVSTDGVFDGDSAPYDESAPPNPLNVYARTKLEGEDAARTAHPCPLVVRASLFGWCPRQERTGLAEWIWGKLGAGMDVPGFVDVWFAPLMSWHLAELLFEMIDRRLAGLYHLSAPAGCSKYEFARLMATEFGCNPNQIKPVSVTDSSLKAPRPKNTILVAARATRALGHSLPTIQAGIAAMEKQLESGYVARLKGR